MTLAALETRANADHLTIFGAFHTSDTDETGAGTLALLGPKEPGFWNAVSTASEFSEGRPDPLDRWSRRAIDAVAGDLNGTAFYPFGTPTRPFLSWALRTGSAWSSPVMLLVHEAAGLLVSYRGAVLLEGKLELPATAEKPCTTCADQPCRTACPVDALTSDGYDIPACHAFLDTDAGQDCLTQGCAVRRACPVSQSYARHPDQSAFHMRQFHP